MKSKKTIIPLLLLGAIVIIIAAFAYNSDYFLGMMFKISRTPVTQTSTPTYTIQDKSIQLEKDVPDSKAQEIQISESMFKLDTNQKLKKANIAVLEFPSDDPARFSNGNLKKADVLEEFYKSYPDDFDFIIFIDYQRNVAEAKHGPTGGAIHRYGPANIGIINSCSFTGIADCPIPSRLRYTNKVSYTDEAINIYPRPFLLDTFMHEIAHYWGLGWYSGSQPSSCYPSWTSDLFESGHWTERFQAGDQSTHAYPTHYWEYYQNPPLHDLSDIPWGQWEDNNDGTFTKHIIDRGEREFNYVDLYQMGLITAQELENKEMFVVLDPEYISGDYNSGEMTYSGTRRDVTLNDLKSFLLTKEQCRNTGPNYYYTGNGERDLQGYPEISNSFRVAFVLLKYPEQPITNRDAYDLCKIVNYDLTGKWYQATDNMSVMHTFLSNSTQSPSCRELFPLNYEETSVSNSVMQLDTEMKEDLFRDDLENHMQSVK
ncbi:hypothetical protein ACFL3C_00150 [Patescibacteria group bacterium]